MTLGQVLGQDRADVTEPNVALGATNGTTGSQ
jgi:hypothetical protein